MRIFIVVAKTRSDLYHYFAEGFTGIASISVILDRRLGPHGPPQAAEGASRGNRRAVGDVYDQLESRGFVIVRLPA